MEYVKKNFKWYALCGILVCNVFIWYAVLAEERRDILTVAFLDVGQGDAIFIEAPNGNQILIDGGPNKSVLRQLSKVMPFYDRSIDVVIATHPDKDHIGGFPDILERYRVDFIMNSELPGESAAYQELLRLTEIKGIKRIKAQRGMVIALDEGVFLKILFPDREEISELESNTSSIAAQLVYGDTEFMLTGDSPKAIEEYLVLLDGEKLSSDVLKVGHHGSKTSTAISFTGLVSPSYAVVSAGANNQYGHPHKEALDTLNQFGATVLSTGDSGTIIFESDGESVIAK
jgi:competence protein ComEC